MVSLCHCYHWHIRCLLAVCQVQVCARQDASQAAREESASLLLPHLRRASASQQLVRVAEVDARQLAAVEAALV
jgi:hypothetical protein